MLPFLLSLAKKIINVCRGKVRKRDLFHTLFHLPGIQLFKIGSLMRKIFSDEDALKAAKIFKKRVTPLIKQSKELEKNYFHNGEFVKQLQFT